MDVPEASGILVVCAANVCRSPLAEFTLRRAFSRMIGFEEIPVRSAGVNAHRAHTVCTTVASVHDGDRWREFAEDHRARPLDTDEVVRASLVLAASRGVRSAVVAAAPESRRRVFTMREAIWLGSGFPQDDAPRGAAAVSAFQEHLDGSRGLRQLPARPRRLLRLGRTPDPLDIPDGHNMGATAHRETIHSVAAAARTIASLIAGSEGDRRR